MQWSVVFFFIFSTAVWAKPSKLVCKRKELARQDCRLVYKGHELRLLSASIAWHDGVWHTVDEMPMKGDGVQWEKVKLEIFKDWPVLQLWLWGPGAGETKVQSLHWYVIGPSKQKLNRMAEGVVRKRRRKLDSPEEKPVYTYDASEKHSLRALKGGNLEWTLGRNKKILERAKHGI